MKFLYTLLILFLVSAQSVFAADIIYSRSGSLSGKIKTYVDGLIVINEKGLEHTISREMNADYFGDYIQYRTSPFTKTTKEANCRIIFVDRYVVYIMTNPANKIEIPRYRVKTMVFNTK